MIKLDSGREITLESLRQEKTYDGLLEGLPRTTLNNGIIERWRGDYESSGLVLIEPVRKKADPNWKDHPGMEEIWGPVEYLPPIVCVGRFESGPVRNEREDFSLLNILWFQNTFALPIDPEVVAQISKLDWENLAYNWTM